MHLFDARPVGDASLDVNSCKKTAISQLRTDPGVGSSPEVVDFRLQIHECTTQPVGHEFDRLGGSDCGDVLGLELE